MKNKFYLLIIVGLALPFSLLQTGCGNSETNGENGGINISPKDTSSNAFKGGQISINGQVFSIPSPVQTAFLIKDRGITYNSEYLNPHDKSDLYSTSFKRALNLGIYGADLGYLTIYDQNDGAMKYLKSVRQLSKNLGLEGAFNEDLATRFSNNLGIQDSLLVLVSEAYKNSDNYLKENDKGDVAALILVGGWIESMYIVADALQDKRDEALIERLGDQKNALNSLVQMLQQFNGDSDYEDILIELEDLYAIFNNIKYTYDYIPPVTDEKNKITVIKSKHKVVMPLATAAAVSLAIVALCSWPGSRRWACRSTMPGMTSLPLASMHSSALNPAGALPMAATLPFSIYRSAFLSS